jgi:hypothetical protein
MVHGCRTVHLFKPVFCIRTQALLNPETLPDPYTNPSYFMTETGIKIIER